MATSLETIFSGVWKRVLSTRNLTTLAQGPSSNAVVVVEPVPYDKDRASSKGKRIRWSFGPTLDAVRTGFVLEILEGGSGAADPSLLPLRVTFSGRDCYGMFDSGSNTLTMHLTGSTNATLVYSVVDEDTLAVSITEVPPGSTGSSKDTSGGIVPLVETGFMFRQHH